MLEYAGQTPQNRLGCDCGVEPVFFSPTASGLNTNRTKPQWLMEGEAPKSDLAAH